MTFSEMYEEVPVTINNSPLINMLLLKLKKSDPVPASVKLLNLSHRYATIQYVLLQVYHIQFGVSVWLRVSVLVTLSM